MNRPDSAARPSSPPTHNESSFVTAVQAYLHSAEQQLSPEVQQQLQTRRQRVLDKQASHLWVGTGSTASLMGLWTQLRSAHLGHYLMLTLVLLTLWFGFGSNTDNGNNTLISSVSVENDDIDSALLSDDLPLNAYLDAGFHTWLTQKSSQH